MRKSKKMTIHAYFDREMKKKADELSVMYNPDAISMDYQTDYVSDDAINADGKSSRYVRTRPGSLTLELLFDARMPGNWTPIDSQLRKLRSLCYEVNPALGEPRYLQVTWGQMEWNGRGYFSGRISSLSYRYTLFDSDATPLRASATLVMTADESLAIQAAEAQLTSPESLVVSVPDATSLPQAANQAIPGSAGRGKYLQLASDNGLDSLDAIKAGSRLSFSIA
jgi:hypothetical protein